MLKLNIGVGWSEEWSLGGKPFTQGKAIMWNIKINTVLCSLFKYSKITKF